MPSEERLPPLPPAAQTQEQAALHTEMETAHRAAFGSTFRITDDEGAMLGPYATLLYAPHIARAFLSIGRCNTPAYSPLTPRELELGILATLGTPRFRPEFPLYAHRHVAAGPSCGFTQAQIDAAEGNSASTVEATGSTMKDSAPQDTGTDDQAEQRLVAAGISDEAELAAWRLARTTARTGGHVEDSVWARAEKALGKGKCAAVVHLTCFYSYASTLMNAVQAKLPPTL